MPPISRNAITFGIGLAWPSQIAYTLERGANFHCCPRSESSKMAPLPPHTVPLAAAVSPYIYVTMGGGGRALSA